MVGVWLWSGCALVVSLVVGLVVVWLRSGCVWLCLVVSGWFWLVLVDSDGALVVSGCGLVVIWL